jgi:hypothetical protein
MCSSQIKKIIFLFCLLSFFFLSFSWAQEKLFKPFIESWPNGKVDWDNGYFYGVGSGSIKLNANSQAQALKVAEAGALSSILQVAARIRVDDRRTLLDLEQQKIIIQLQGLIEYEPYGQQIVKKGNDTFMQVTYRAPLRGVKGLTRQLLTHLREEVTSLQEIPVSQSKAEADESQPWLVLDARNLARDGSLQPALFPKIVTEKGETVSDLNTVDAKALVEQGMMHYVVSDKPPNEISLNGSIDPIAVLRKLLSPSTAWAQGQSQLKKRGHYIIKNVQQAQGLARTTLVISEADAKDLKAEDAASQILKKCRVIVVVSGSVGGIEGRLPGPFAFLW